MRPDPGKKVRPGVATGAAQEDSGGYLNLTSHPTAPQEPSAWLRAATARRVAQIRALGLDLTGIGAVVAPLGKAGAPGELSDRECDRCGRVAPVGELFYPLIVQPLPTLHLFGGLCQACQRREVCA